MEIGNIGQSSSSCSQETSEPKHCWICLGTDGDDDNESNSEWVSPCKCRGTTRWVHQVCVNRWISEILMANNNAEVHCTQCHTKYIIIKEEVNYLVQVLNRLDYTANRIYPYMTAVMVFTSIYWSAASYGAITMMQVMGQKQAITIMENTDTLMLLIGLPSIPVSLYFVNTINWEENLLFYVQRFTSHLPLLRTIMPSLLCEPVDSSSTVQFNPFTNPTTTLCPALLFPSTATLVGLLLFNNSSYSRLLKSLLGGLVYVAVKGVIRIYQRQQNIIRRKTRKIIDYSESDTEEIN